MCLYYFYFDIQRQQKIQRERLMNDFSSALNNFQAVQRQAAEKEKESVARARAGSRLSVCRTAVDTVLCSAKPVSGCFFVFWTSWRICKWLLLILVFLKVMLMLVMLFLKITSFHFPHPPGPETRVTGSHAGFTPATFSLWRLTNVGHIEGN